MKAQLATWTDLATVMSLDDVILCHLYLDALEEAQAASSRKTEP